ncbi:MAG: recombination regulator RecX [Salibacteraceae bacterium]|nr:recombination regulator RecX [Salibacteraceae bacterium]
MALPSKQITLTEAIIKARTFCNYRERCHQELRQKLYDLGLWTRDVDHVIGQMIEENLLNEERFAKGYARGHFYQKRWGKYKIAVELKQRGLNERLIKTSLSEIDEDDYLAMIEHLIEKKKRELSGDKRIQKQKVARYLMQKGYQFQDFGALLDKAFISK